VILTAKAHRIETQENIPAGLLDKNGTLEAWLMGLSQYWMTNRHRRMHPADQAHAALDDDERCRHAEGHQEKSGDEDST